MNASNKNPIKSKTVWGVLIATLPVIFPALAPAVPVLLASLPDQVAAPSPEIQAIAAGIGAIVAIYGRYKAEGKLSFK